MSNNKQTAVEWLVEQIEEKTKNGTFCTIDYMRKHCFEQAKEMDMQQKREFFEQGHKSGITDYIDIQNGYDGRAIGFEKYYKEKYGK